MDSKPRLLVITSTFPRWTGDPEPGFVYELSRRLTEKFHIKVVCPSAPGVVKHENLDGLEVSRFTYAPNKLQTLVNDGGIVTNLKQQPWKWLLAPLFLIAEFLAVRQAVKSFKPNVVHAHWLIPQGLILALVSLTMKKSPPFLVTSHGADLHALRSWPMPALKRFVAKRAAAMTVVSKAMLDAMQTQGIPIEGVHVEPMGVDLEQRFKPDPSVARSEYEMLFVGRLVEKKGLRILIDAMPAILKQHPESRLIVAGFGPEEFSIRHQIERLGLGKCIKFLGAVPQEQLPALYHRATVFIAPFIEAKSGDQEGLGLVTIEAIGCGCPVLVSDLPAVRDLVQDPCIRISPGDDNALSAAVNEFFERPQAERQEMSGQMRNQALVKFDWRPRAVAYCAILSGMNAD